MCYGMYIIYIYIIVCVRMHAILYMNILCKSMIRHAFIQGSTTVNVRHGSPAASTSTCLARRLVLAQGNDVRSTVVQMDKVKTAGLVELWLYLNNVLHKIMVMYNQITTISRLFMLINNLVGGLEHVLFSIIYGMSSFPLTFICFKMVVGPPTRLLLTIIITIINHILIVYYQPMDISI